MVTIDIFSFLLALAGLALGALVFVVTGGTGVQLLATVLVGGSAFVVGLLVGRPLRGVADTALSVSVTEPPAPADFDDVDLGGFGVPSRRPLAASGIDSAIPERDSSHVRRRPIAASERR